MTEEILRNFNIKGFQEDLLFWYQNNKRDLPWSQDQNPYKIWGIRSKTSGNTGINIFWPGTEFNIIKVKDRTNNIT